MTETTTTTNGIPVELRHDTPPDTRAAIIAFEVNRLYRASIGEDPGPTWDDAPGWKRALVISGVREIHAGIVMIPKESHESWCDTMQGDGWIYGPTRDEAAKTHPNLVPYAALPIEQRRKDALFLMVVSTLQ